MARKRSTAGNSIELTLDGEEITSTRFLKGVTALFDLVGEVTESRCGTRAAAAWIVYADKGSLVLGATPKPRDADIGALVYEVPALVIGGLLALNSQPHRPAHFSDVALQRARDLSSLLAPQDDKITKVELRANGTTVTVQPDVATNVTKVLGRIAYETGSVEGVVRTITSTSGRYFVVYDRLSGHGVRCEFDDDMENEVMDAFDKRVVASGKLKYKGGEPVAIELESIRVVGGRTLPTAADVRGILSR